MESSNTRAMATLVLWSSDDEVALDDNDCVGDTRGAPSDGEDDGEGSSHGEAGEGESDGDSAEDVEEDADADDTEGGVAGIARSHRGAIQIE